MGEVFCGILTGLGFGVEPSGRHNDGCFLIAIKVEAFRPLLTFRKEVADFAHYLKDTPPAKGSQGVLYPGEVEHRAEQQRAAEGIEIEEATWAKLKGLAEAGGLTAKLGFA
jgi:LDH2 family malate/lactate/ureidoglycolate dehydrogenase